MYGTSIEEQPVHYLFVYGTLRKGCTTGAHKEYLSQADYITRAKIRGELFMVDYYPGLVLSESEQWTLGEVYLVKHPSHLHELDVYEGCAEQSPRPHEYERRLAEIILSSGETMQAWTYVYQQDTTRFESITSGDFLNRY